MKISSAKKCALKNGGITVTNLNVSDLIEKLNLTCAAGADGTDRQINGCYIGDLMSLAMTGVREDMVWITIQTNINVVAVASLADGACIIMPDGTAPDENTRAKANELGIPILTTPLTAYETAKALAALGV